MLTQILGLAVLGELGSRAGPRAPRPDAMGVLPARARPIPGVAGLRPECNGSDWAKPYIILGLAVLGDLGSRAGRDAGRPGESQGPGCAQNAMGFTGRSPTHAWPGFAQ